MSQLDQSFDASRYMLANRVLSRAIVAIGTAKAAINTTAAVVYSVNGIIYNKAAMTSQVLTNATGPVLNGTAAGATYVQPVGYTVYYVVCLDAAGTVSVVQGSYLGQNLGQPGAVGDGTIPDVPSTVTPFALIKVATAVAATFTLGTTLFDASNVTTTFYDIAVLPGGTV